MNLLISFALLLAAVAPALSTSWEVSTDSTRNPKMVAITMEMHVELAPYPALVTTHPFPARFKGDSVSYCHMLPATVPAAQMPAPTITVTQPTVTTSGALVITRPAYTTEEVTNILNAKKQNQTIDYAATAGCQIN